MSGGATREIALYLRQLFGEGTLAGLTDGQLLDRFRADGDDAAFTALVARHGPMVLGVCRSVLRDPDAAEDAFQATFLVLARRAGTVRGSASVGGWLHRVARRVAGRASAARRGTPGTPLPPDRDDPAPDADPARAASRRELRAIVHEELARLPEPYRAVVLLCDLEGLSHEAAASRLRWPIGTVKGRLSRGRDRLRDRLGRRGVAGPAPLLAGWQATIGDALAGRTVALACGPAGAVPAGVAYLVTEALRSMFWMKVGQWALGIGLLGMLAGGAAALGPRDGDGDDQGLTPAPAPAPVAAADEPDDRLRLAGERADVELMAIEQEARKSAIAALAEALAAHDVSGRLPDRPAPTADEVHALRAALDRHKDAYRRAAVELERRKNGLATAPGPRVFRPGDLITVEVLEALPGRPIAGPRVVRPDGTVGLGFYGDVHVAGLTRHDAKEKIVLHMRKFMNDDILGLKEVDPETGKPVAVPPADSDRVFVDDSLNDFPPETRPEIAPGRRRPDPTTQRLINMETRLDQIYRRLPAPPAPEPAPASR
jgi:RNA polymerase sigma factor (sigma-70 family)